MKTKRLYINTIGCQMNVYDSEQIAKKLIPLGYKMTSDLDSADAIIVNTCAIRAKAEQKAFSFLGRLSDLKIKNPDLIIGVGGCVAQQEGEKILRRMPHVDLVFGTHAVSRLPRIIKQVESKKCRMVDTELSTTLNEFAPSISVPYDGSVTKFVTIMQGCDNFCTYCVVPYVRGRETSRAPEHIIAEIRNLVEGGVREVTLLGQNVNSYGKKESLCSFAELLARVNEVDGLKRIRFTTSHPKDFSEDLMCAFRNVEKLCKHIHLPVQSGANSVLKRMNRKYTRELYLEKVDQLRSLCPDVAITSDFIVGFPGETDADFGQTLDLIKTVRFDGVFAFKYSDRPNAPAARFPGKVSEEVKKDRLKALLELQEVITSQINEALVGSTQMILVDGLSKKQNGGVARDRLRNVQWTGRTSTNKIVNFALDDGIVFSEEIFEGKLMNIRIEKALAHSLWGKPLEHEPVSLAVKGEEDYAA